MHLEKDDSVEFSYDDACLSTTTWSSDFATVNGNEYTVDSHSDALNSDSDAALADGTVLTPPAAANLITELRFLTSGTHEDDNGTGFLSYTVTRVAAYPKTEFPAEDVFIGDGTPTLVLVTCGGVFDQGARSFEDNVIVWLEAADE